ncbi:MAG: hypothetical protein ACKVH8_05280 [Pirellulales bacterium]|jgi:hypothetical protein
MAFGHTDDVPNAVVPEVWSTPESSSVPPGIQHEPDPDETGSVFRNTFYVFSKESEA